MDIYRRKLAHAQWTWREEKTCRYHGPSRNKDRIDGRADKRSARQQDRHDLDEQLTADEISSDPCRNGTCAFCADGGGETDFERTRMYAAQRGAI